MNRYEPGGRPPEENTVRRLAELSEPDLRAVLAFVRQAGPHSLHPHYLTGVPYPTLFLRLIADAVGYSAASHWSCPVFTYDVPVRWGVEEGDTAPLSAVATVCFELDVVGRQIAPSSYGERVVGDWNVYARRGIDDLCARMDGRVWPELERLAGKALDARVAAAKAGAVERRVEALQAQVSELQTALTQVGTALGWLLRSVPRSTWARGGSEVVELVGELADGMAAWPGDGAAADTGPGDDEVAKPGSGNADGQD